MNLKMALFILGTLFFSTTASAKTKVFYAPTENSISWENSPNSIMWIGNAKVEDQGWFMVIGTNQKTPPKVSALKTPPTIEPLIENGKLLYKAQFYFETLPAHTKMSLLTIISGFDSCTVNKIEQNITCVKD